LITYLVYGCHCGDRYHGKANQVVNDISTGSFSSSLSKCLDHLFSQGDQALDALERVFSLIQNCVTEK